MGDRERGGTLGTFFFVIGNCHLGIEMNTPPLFDAECLLQLIVRRSKSKAADSPDADCL
jgi:hypothetical protein